MVSRTCLRLCLVAAVLSIAAAADNSWVAQYNSQWNAGIYQSANNIAAGNKGPVNQQSSNQAISQKGNNNYASTYNDQQIVGCDTSGVNQQASNQAVQQKGNGNTGGTGNNQGISGRRLAGTVTASSSSNVAAGANGVNQQSSNQAITQTGNNNYASTSATGLIKCNGRRLLNA